MSPRQATTEVGGGRTAITVALAVVVAVVMLLLARGRPGDEPFDPRSGAAQGTSGLVLLLRELGAEVSVTRTVPSPSTDVRLMVISDRLAASQRDEVEAFTEAGGFTVVADPGSELISESFRTGASTEIDAFVPEFDPDDSADSLANVKRGSCSIPALSRLRGLTVPTGRLFAVPDGALSCFGDATTAAVVATQAGDGTMVAVGSNTALTNDLLRYADNAGLATALLAPSADARVVILLGGEAPKTAADIGTGDKTLTDLVRPGVWMALTQLAIAFVVLVVAVAVRTGRPLHEPVVVPLAGSDLVAANGMLMHRAGHAHRAGWLIRGRLYRLLATRYRLPPTVSVEQLDQAAVHRDAATPGAVAALLACDVSTTDELVELSRAATDFHQRLAPTAPLPAPTEMT
jgi:hypothetical protein